MIRLYVQLLAIVVENGSGYIGPLVLGVGIPAYCE